MADTLPAIALTADQEHSRSTRDRVPEALAALAGVDLWLPAERTAGDELQTLCRDARSAVAACTALVRLGGWRIGLGVGAVESPLPASTREARGTAYVAARSAVDLAHRQGIGLVSVRPGRACDRAAAVSVVWQALLSKRSDEGWQVVQMVEEGLSGREAAARIGISPSAVSQRLARADLVAGRHATELFIDLLTAAVEEL